MSSPPPDTTAVAELQSRRDPLWLAVTAEHPLLPGVAWRGLDALGLPLLRLPGQLNTAPTTSPPRPRVALCVSMPMAKARSRPTTWSAKPWTRWSSWKWEPTCTCSPTPNGRRCSRPGSGCGPGSTTPALQGPHRVVRRSHRPGREWTGDEQPWLLWVEDQMDGRLDVLHLIGHGYLSTGQGAFAVAETPDQNHDTAMARFVWPQQIAALMTSTGAWGLVVTAAPQNYTVMLL